MTEEVVRTRLSESRVKEYFPVTVRIIKGYLGDMLPVFPDRRIAFLHLDVDLYPGYRDGLQYLFDEVRLGGIVAFDEYREFHPELPEYVASDGSWIEKWPGCSRAVDEFFKTRPQSMELLRKDFFSALEAL